MAKAAAKTASKINPKDDDQAGKDAEAPEKDSPLLDLSDAAVKKLIKAAKVRGYVTFDALNAVLPQGETSSEAIEDVNQIMTSLRAVLDQLEEVLETLELAEVQKTADERDIQSLRNALRVTDRPDRPPRRDPGSRPEQPPGGGRGNDRRQGRR